MRCHGSARAYPVWNLPQNWLRSTVLRRGALSRSMTASSGCATAVGHSFASLLQSLIPISRGTKVGIQSRYSRIWARGCSKSAVHLLRRRDRIATDPRQSLTKIADATGVAPAQGGWLGSQILFAFDGVPLLGKHKCRQRIHPFLDVDQSAPSPAVHHTLVLPSYLGGLPGRARRVLDRSGIDAR